MKVLYVITRADLGGAQTHLLDLLNGLNRQVTPIVATGEEGFFTKAVRDLGIDCHVVPELVQRIAPIKDLRALWRLIFVIRDTGPDLVHVHTSKAGILGRFAALIGGVPSVYTAHTWCFAEGTRWWWKIAGIPAERLAARCSPVIINVSEANRKLALRHSIAGESRLRTIHNGIPDVSARAQPGLPGVPRIVMVARCTPQKDQALLLRALAYIDPPTRVVLVGDGPTRASLEATACRLKIRDRVDFLGERRDVPEILATSHIFALPTKWEGFPLCILEAMRAGLPVVASDTGGVAEALIDRQNGFLVPRGDYVALGGRLKALIGDAFLRARMGEAGRRRYEAEFTREAMLQKTLDVYHEIIRGSARQPATHAQPRTYREVSRDLSHVRK